MHLFPIIKKVAIPKFEEHGYHLSFKDSGYYTFKNSKETIEADLQCGKKCPAPLLREFVELPQKEPQLPPASIHMQHWVRATQQHRLLPVEGERLCLDTPLKSAYFYRDKETFTHSLELLLQQFFTVVLPYLEDVSSRVVFVNNRLYKLLAQDPGKRTAYFAEKHSLPLEGETEDISQSVQRVFLELLPKDTKDRLKCFVEKEDEIIDFAAYCGEMIMRKKEGIWTALPPLAFSGYDTIYAYGIQFEKERYHTDPLWYIINSWNFSPQVSFVGLYDRLFWRHF